MPDEEKVEQTEQNEPVDDSEFQSAFNEFIAAKFIEYNIFINIFVKSLKSSMQLQAYSKDG